MQLDLSLCKTVLLIKHQLTVLRKLLCKENLSNAYLAWNKQYIKNLFIFICLISGLIRYLSEAQILYFLVNNIKQYMYFETASILKNCIKEDIRYKDLQIVLSGSKSIVMLFLLKIRKITMVWTVLIRNTIKDKKRRILNTLRNFEKYVI